jgi:hypothetical protein
VLRLFSAGQGRVRVSPSVSRAPGRGIGKMLYILYVVFLAQRRAKYRNTEQLPLCKRVRRSFRFKIAIPGQSPACDPSGPGDPSIYDGPGSSRQGQRTGDIPQSPVSILSTEGDCIIALHRCSGQHGGGVSDRVVCFVYSVWASPASPASPSDPGCQGAAEPLYGLFPSSTSYSLCSPSFSLFPFD